MQPAVYEATEYLMVRELHDLAWAAHCDSKPATTGDDVNNGVPHDKRDQLEKVQAGLLQGEIIKAVFDCTGVGTGFVGLTDRRVILQDNSFVGKRSAITSIPLHQVQRISFVSDKSMFGSFYSSATIAIVAGGAVHEATFRGTDKAKYIHDVILWEITSGPSSGT